jgi:heterodisulfide reductase subunit D
LGRHLGVFEPPRELLNRIPGLEITEMQRNRNTASCCGAGAGVKGAFPEISMEIAKKRVKEALGTGATIISSACPFCKRNLQEATEKIGGSAEVYDIVELAAKSVEGTSLRAN